MNKTYNNFIKKAKIIALVIIMLFCMVEKINAQLPAGVTFNGYTLAKSASQNPPIRDAVPQYWSLEQDSPDLDNMDTTFREGGVGLWRYAPATLFPNTITYMLIGGHNIATSRPRSESLVTNISGLTINKSYTYSFLATANDIASYTSTSITIGLYFNGTLVDSKVLAVGAVASRQYFSFTAPAASGTLSIGVVGAVGGSLGNSPWYLIGGGTGQFTLTCNAGSTAPTLSASTLSTTCPASTANLNSLHTGTVPTGASLVWFTNNTNTGTAYATPATATPGTYYAYYYDSANNCYSPASAAVTVTIAPCCNAGATGPNIN